MFLLAANRLLLLAILVLVPFHTVGTVVLPKSDVPQSAGSTPKHGQARCGLEMLTDTEGIDFDTYLRTVYISVRQNWFAVMPPSVATGQQGVNRVEFRIMQDGKIPEDFVKQTGHSGKEDLDRASLTAIHALTPFDHLPERFSQPFIALRFTFSYNMPSEKHQKGDSTKSTRTLD
ncbi:MAG: TonB C-terminal domain-containing protein [Candidatus Acidiferrum sp.]